MKKMNRKSFIKKAGVLSLTAVSGAALLASCGGSSSESDNSTVENATDPAPSSESPAVEAPSQTQASVDCSEYNQELTEADLNMRQNLEYVEESPKEDQLCNNCRFWLPDKFEGSCGGCQLLANGAVNPQGWCRSWVTQQV